MAVTGLLISTVMQKVGHEHVSRKFLQERAGRRLSRADHELLLFDVIVPGTHKSINSIADQRTRKTIANVECCTLCIFFPG
jgi:hypothetical protein